MLQTMPIARRPKTMAEVPSSLKFEEGSEELNTGDEQQGHSNDRRYHHDDPTDRTELLLMPLFLEKCVFFSSVSILAFMMSSISNSSDALLLYSVTLIRPRSMP